MKKLRCRTCLLDFEYQGTEIVPEHTHQHVPAVCPGGLREGEIVEDGTADLDEPSRGELVRETPAPEVEASFDVVPPVPSKSIERMVGEYTELYKSVQLGLHRNQQVLSSQVQQYASRIEALSGEVASMREAYGRSVDYSSRIAALERQAGFTPMFGYQIPLRIIALAALIMGVVSAMFAVSAAL